MKLIQMYCKDTRRLEWNRDAPHMVVGWHYLLQRKSSSDKQNRM